MSIQTHTFDEFDAMDTDKVMNKLGEMNDTGLFEMEVNSKTKPTAFPANFTRTAVNTVEIEQDYNIYHVLPHDIIGNVEVNYYDDYIRFDYEARGFQYVVVEISNITKPFTKEQKDTTLSIFKSRLNNVDKVKSVEVYEEYDYNRLEVEVEHSQSWTDEIKIEYHLNKVLGPIRSEINSFDDLFDDIQIHTPNRINHRYADNVYNRPIVSIYVE